MVGDKYTWLAPLAGSLLLCPYSSPAVLHEVGEVIYSLVENKMNISTVRLRSVLPSTESDSAVSCPQQSQTPQCPALSRVRLHSVLPSAESDFAVSCPQQSQTPQCPALSRVRLRSVLPSTESDSAVSCPQQSQTSRCPALSRVRLRGVLYPPSLI